MASTYEISAGSESVEIDGVSPDQPYVGVQVVQSSLDATITIKLKQTEDEVQFHDLPENPVTMETTVDSVLLQSNSYRLTKLYIDIDVGSATTGTLNFFAVSRG